MSYTNYNHKFRRSALSEPAQLSALFNFWTPTVGQKNMLGAKFDLDDGRRWRYQKAGSSGLTKALINQSAVGAANWQDEVQTNSPSLPSAGDETVTLTLTDTATAGAFIDAYLTIEDGTGENEMYIIKDNKAGVANATTGWDIVCEIADAGGIRVAWEAASELTVTVNKYNDVIVFPTNPTGVATGVSHATVTADFYFWGQTLGPCIVTKDTTDTIIVGDMAGIAPNTAGTVGLMDAAAEGDVLAGHVMRAPASGETALIDLRLE